MKIFNLVLLLLFFQKDLCFSKPFQFGTLYLDPSNYNWNLSGNIISDSKFTGQIFNNVPNGLGSLIEMNGRNYHGEFSDGKIEGNGSVESNFYSYKGRWNNFKCSNNIYCH